MNTDTGHLVRDIEQIDEAMRERYTRVPGELGRAARRALGDRAEVTIPRSSNGALAKWARAERKRKRKQAKAGRRAARKRR